MHVRVAKIPYETCVKPVPEGTIIPARTPVNRKTKFSQLQRCELDGRSVTARLFTKLARGVQNDIAPDGGELSVVQQALIETFCGITVMIDHMNARLLRGEPLDVAEFAMCSSVLVRLSTRLGITRAPRLPPHDPHANEREARDVAALKGAIEDIADGLFAEEEAAAQIEREGAK